MKSKIIIFSACIISLGSAYADSYQVCFTPGGQCTQNIVNAINNARSDINVQAYGFTSLPIINALISAEKRGVKVQVILDKSNLSGNNKSIPMLQSANIPVWIDYTVAIAHNKVMIIDDQEVITGSFNFTASAQERNAENSLIIIDSNLAASYQQNFQNRQQQSVTYQQCLTIKKCSHSKYEGN